MLTIPGIDTVHDWPAWVDPRYPVTGPPAPWGDIDTAVIHYTAADDLIDGDPGEHAENLPAYIRGMQRSYVIQRGYSLGYWFAVDWLGGVWRVRGWDIKSAANAGHNDHTAPFLVLVDGNDGATPQAARSIRCLVAEGQRRARRQWAIKGHGQLRRETGIGTPTACCGTGLQHQIDTGEFVPRLDPPKPTPPSPLDPPEEDMLINLIRLDGTLAVYAQYSGGYKVWLRTEDVLKTYEWLSGKTVQVFKAEHRALFEASGPIIGDRPAGVDTYGIPL